MGIEIITEIWPEWKVLEMIGKGSFGLFVSSLFKNSDAAMAVAPILLMPQLLFSGLIFELEGAAKILSWFVACRFSMEGYGTTANLNDLPTLLQNQGFMVTRTAEDYFTYTTAHFGFAIGMLCVFVLVFSVASGCALRNIKKAS